MICMENFEDEQAIRLTACVHVIGLDCFGDWLRRHPDTCPHLTHKLPRASSSGNKGFTYMLEWLTSTRWFESAEGESLQLIYLWMVLKEIFIPWLMGFEEQEQPLFQHRLGIDALHIRRLTVAQALQILVVYTLAIIASTSVNLGIWHILYLGMCHILLMICPSLVKPNTVDMVHTTVVVLEKCHAVLFVGVVLAVLALDLWRTHTQSKKKEVAA